MIPLPSSGRDSVHPRSFVRFGSDTVSTGGGGSTTRTGAGFRTGSFLAQPDIQITARNKRQAAGQNFRPLIRNSPYKRIQPGVLPARRAYGAAPLAGVAGVLDSSRG